MENYFFLLSQEFDLRIKQAKDFIKNHNPSLGALNEEILRKFLKDHLPKWVDVAHGFILSKEGNISNQCDIIIYNSTYYAPLYRVNDLVIVPPESVICTVEVKTKLDQEKLHEQFPKFKTVKTICPNADSSIFIYYPPRWETIIEYINKYNFSEYDDTHLPDKIYGFNSFCLSKSNIKGKSKDGVGYMNISFHDTKKQNASFEHFFYDIYQKIEMQINKDLKAGIDNIWVLEGDTLTPKGRLSYSKSGISKMQFGTIIFEKEFKSNYR